MTDTILLENIAVSLSVHNLTAYGILVAKPFFDTKGADLLVFTSMEDNAKMARIQCKYRSLENSRQTHVTIKSKYISRSLIVMVKIEDGSRRTELLYCFFEDDVKNWRVNSSGNFVLRISRKGFEENLRDFTFNDEKIERIREILDTSNAKEEMSILGLPLRSDEEEMLIKSDEVEKVWLEEGFYGFHPIIRNNTTGIVRVGAMCPGDPRDYLYSSNTDSWAST